MRPPAVLGLVQLTGGSWFWRIGSPFAELKRRGYPVAWGFNDDPRASEVIDRADVVVMHRLAWAPGDEDKALAWRDLLHRGGKCLIYEFDDDLVSPAILDRIRDADEEDKSAAQLEQEREARIFALRLADGVTCSTEALADVARRYTDATVEVVPNAIDLGFWSGALAESKRVVDRPAIGWAGGNRPDSDAETAAEAWRRIAGCYPHVNFVVAGHPLRALIESVPVERLHFFARLPIAEYPKVYANIDIGCAVLEPNDFNRCKSPIKALEYAAAGAAVVASPTVYGDLLEHSRDGYVCETADEWEAALVSLIEHPEYRNVMADRLGQKVEREHSLAGNAHRWPEAWARIADTFRAGVAFRPVVVA